ncbi:MAG TPA: methyltransferase domain-containing protein [Phycisphaerae bacterium]|nr:methyltransferase domain-containing protein [Phycisphaerae bacterium]
MIERLAFDQQSRFNAIEASSHLARYALAQPFCKGKHVLDVACGEGYGAYFMRRHWGAARVDAVDVAPEAIDAAKRLFDDKRIRYHCHAAEKIDELFEPASFDLIVSLETIEHVQDARTFLEVLKRHAKPGGTVIVTCPNDYWYYPTREESNPFHVRKFTLDEFRELAEAVFGPAKLFLLGTPVGGFTNLARDNPRLHVGGGEDAALSITKTTRLDHALGLPSDEKVSEKNCSYFVGIWSADDVSAAEASTIVFPCSMSASAPAAEHTKVTNLRDEVVSLRDQLFSARAMLQQREREVTALQEQTRKLQSELRLVGLRASAFQAENEFIREEFQELRTQLVQLQQQCDEQARTIEKLGGTIDEQARTIGKLEGTIEEQNALIADWRRRIENLDRVKRLIPGPAKSALKWLLRWK